MSHAAVQTEPRPSRLRALVVPREHGAWGILLVPLFTGACVGLAQTPRLLPVAWFTLAALALFWLRAPLEGWLGTTPLKAQTAAEKRTLWIASLSLGTAAAICLGVLLVPGGNRGLWLLGGLAGLAFAIQAGLKKLGRRFRMVAQLVGAVGLTSTAPGAYYVATGQLDARALALWLANWLFAGDQIHFVQLRIHAARAAGWKEKLRRGWLFFAGQFLMLLALGVAAGFGLLPWWTLAAFLPVLFRGLAWFPGPPEPLQVRRLGWSELSQSVIFGLLLVAAFLHG